jgi:selenide,water dikinase
LNDHVTYEDGIDKPSQLVLCDAQTSGGLLIAVAPDRAAALVDKLRELGTPAHAVIGQLDAEPVGRMHVAARRP